MKKKKDDVTLHKKVWCKIRYVQKLHDISNKDLAAYLGVSERTLLEYDKSAANLTLGKIENFLKSVDLEFSELLAL